GKDLGGAGRQEVTVDNRAADADRAAARAHLKLLLEREDSIGRHVAQLGKRVLMQRFLNLQSVFLCGVEIRDLTARAPGPAAHRHGAAEKTLRERARLEHRNSTRAGRLPRNDYLRGIAAELRDVPVDP